jgi:biotin carboxylase
MYCVIIEPRLALHRYIPIARQRFKTLVVCRNREATLQSERQQYAELGLPETSQIDDFVICDSSDPDAIWQQLTPYHSAIAAVLPADEPVISVAAEIARRLGFDVPSADDILAQHVKSAMKRRFLERGVPTAPFVVATTLEDAMAAWERFDRNAIVKMVDYASSINVTYARTAQDVADAWHNIIDNRLNLPSSVPFRREVLVEQCVFGRELSVEGYVARGRVVILNSCEKLTEKNFQIVGHFVPSRLSPDEDRMVRSAAEACVRALGVRNSVFHLEVHICEGEPYVIECASRPPGHHVCELIAQSRGVDLMDVNVRLAVGEAVAVEASEPQVHFGIFVLYTNETGVLQEITKLDELRARASLRHLSLRVSPTDQVEKLVSPDQRYGIVLLADATAEGVRAEAEWMRANVRFVVKQ